MIWAMQTLSTIHDVIRALGENDEEAGAVVGVGVKAVRQWKHRKRLPQRKYFMITEALAAKGKMADPALWGFEAPAKDVQ